MQIDERNSDFRSRFEEVHFEDNALPFDDALEQEETVQTNASTKIKDRLMLLSKAEKTNVFVTGAASFLVSMYLIGILLIFFSSFTAGIKAQINYSPLNFLPLMAAKGSPAIFILTFSLSSLIGYGALTSMTKYLRDKENGFVERSKSGKYGNADWINNDRKQLEETFEISEEIEKPPYLPIGIYKDKVYGAPENPSHNQFKNLNCCVIGGSGSGKSFTVISPAIMNRIAYGESFLVTDTKGDLYKDHARLCEKAGYKVYCFNTVSFKHSDAWNLLSDLIEASESDIFNYIDIYSNIFIKNTSADPNKEGDYWEKNEHDLLRCILHLVCRDRQYEGQRTFQTVMDLINGEEKEIKARLEAATGSVRSAVRSYLSATDDRLRENYRSGLANRLQIFRTPEVSAALSYDGIDFEELVHEKCAIFLITKDSDTTYDAITSLFVTSLYIKLVEISSSKTYRGKLKKSFWFIIDELCNMAAIMDLSRKISTTRSRRMNFILAIQSVSQLDKKYPRLAHNILANCGIIYFLGSDDAETNTLVSKRLGTYTQIVKDTTTHRSNIKPLEKVIFPVMKKLRVSEQKKALMEESELSQFKSGQMLALISGKKPFRGTGYAETNHALYQYREERSPYDNRPQWYEDYLLRQQDMRLIADREYIPSEHEERDVEPVFDLKERGELVTAEVRSRFEGLAKMPSKERIEEIFERAREKEREERSRQEGVETPCPAPVKREETESYNDIF